MFRHVALFRWRSGTSDEQVDGLRRALGELPALIPELRDYRIGRDLGLVQGNWDLAVVADFADAAGWQAYVAHPAHQSVIAAHLRPILADRSAVQYDT